MRGCPGLPPASPAATSQTGAAISRPLDAPAPPSRRPRRPRSRPRCSSTLGRGTLSRQAPQAR
eukprot:5465656-Lingulodinium_polyedra.AAC.1